MRALQRGTKTLGTLAVATALGAASASGAFACPLPQQARPIVTAPLVANETKLAMARDRVVAHFQHKLDWLAAYAGALRTRVDALAAGTVLTPEQRFGAEKKVAYVAALRRFLANLPASGLFAPTAAQRAQIAQIDAVLAHVAARLTTLLANTAPLTAKVVVKPLRLADIKVADMRAMRFSPRHWPVRFRDRDRFGGDRFGADRHRCDHDR